MLPTRWTRLCTVLAVTAALSGAAAPAAFAQGRGHDDGRHDGPTVSQNGPGNRGNDRGGPGNRGGDSDDRGDHGDRDGRGDREGGGPDGQWNNNWTNNAPPVVVQPPPVFVQPPVVQPVP